MYDAYTSYRYAYHCQETIDTSSVKNDMHETNAEFLMNIHFNCYRRLSNNIGISCVNRQTSKVSCTLLCLLILYDIRWHHV